MLDLPVNDRGLDALEGEKRKDETVGAFSVDLQQVEAVRRKFVQHGPERHARHGALLER